MKERGIKEQRKDEEKEEVRKKTCREGKQRGKEGKRLIISTV